jgi:hypothetical protein
VLDLGEQIERGEVLGLALERLRHRELGIVELADLGEHRGVTENVLDL